MDGQWMPHWWIQVFLAKSKVWPNFCLGFVRLPRSKCRMLATMLIDLIYYVKNVGYQLSASSGRSKEVLTYGLQRIGWGSYEFGEFWENNSFGLKFGLDLSVFSTIHIVDFIFLTDQGSSHSHMVSEV
ncbi:hypothetical protein HanIR_Chr08g0376601 [Helianthus annuus]|nr:hypothetical protein HanIR_Chr08g0376601 [Helianthus annuus]